MSNVKLNKVIKGVVRDYQINVHFILYNSFLIFIKLKILSDPHEDITWKNSIGGQEKQDTKTFTG